MEGDVNRYSIPVEAIVSCEPTMHYAPGDRHRVIQHCLVRLVVTSTDGPRELLLALIEPRRRHRINTTRRRAAAELSRWITQLADAAAAGSE